MTISTAAPTHLFQVERTDYGWQVSDGILRRGLFVTLKAAMEDVRARGKVLRRLRETWSVTVIGSDTTKSADRFVLSQRRSGAW